MKIYHDNTYTEVQPKDSSYLLNEIGGDHIVSLEFSLTYFVDFPIGSYVVVDGDVFKTYKLGAFTKINDRQYDYTLSFGDKTEETKKYKFRNHVDRRLKFTLTAKPHEFVEHIVINLRERDKETNWQVGDCIECSERTQSFNHNSIREALDSIAKLFDTEWEIVGTTINLRKTEYNKTAPLELAYGRGNGFKSGIGRKLSDEQAIDVLYVEGGDRNIDQSKYTYTKVIEGQEQTLHADTLRLPKNAAFIYFPPETEEITDPDNVDYGTLYDNGTSMPSEMREKGFVFRTDEDGFCMYRDNYIANGYEDSIDLTDIYPMREETISNVLTENGTEVYVDGAAVNADPHHFYDVVFAENVVDYSDKSIWESGENVTVIFQQGMLQGKEFNVSGYNRAEKRLKIQPQEKDGITMPDIPSGYMPKIGEKCALFHIKLPDEYITEAERKMALQSANYLWKHSEPEVEFQGEIDGIWARKNWADIRNKIGLGYYVRFTDENIARDGKLMRIVSIKYYINKPHSPELTLSNTTVAQGVSSQLKKIAQNEVYTQTEISEVAQFAKRSFRDSRETLSMLENAFKGQYTEGISPTTVNTMMALIGDESLQFEFGTVQYKSDNVHVARFTPITWEPTYDANTRTLHLRTDLIVRHNSYVNVNGKTNVIASTLGDEYYPYWQMMSPSEITLEAGKDDIPYYLYAVVSKDAVSSSNIGKVLQTGQYVLSETPLQNTTSNYYLQIGTLNSANYDGARSFASVYGKTEILGNRITTDLIRSNSGNTYIDLVNDIIVGKFNFKNGLIGADVLIGASEASSNSGIAGSNVYDGDDYDTYGDTAAVREVRLWVGGRLSTLADGRRLVRGAKFCVYADSTFKCYGVNINSNQLEAGKLYATLLNCATATASEVNATNIKSSQSLIRSTNRWSGGLLSNEVPFLVMQAHVHYANDTYYIDNSDGNGQARIGSSSNNTFRDHVSCRRIAVGQCAIDFDYPWQSSSNYFVTAYGNSKSEYTTIKSRCYVSVIEKTTEHIYFCLGDDDSPNDFDFEFQIWSYGYY